MNSISGEDIFAPKREPRVVPPLSLHGYHVIAGYQVAMVSSRGELSLTPIRLTRDTQTLMEELVFLLTQAPRLAEREDLSFAKPMAARPPGTQRRALFQTEALTLTSGETWEYVRTLAATLLSPKLTEGEWPFVPGAITPGRLEATRRLYREVTELRRSITPLQHAVQEHLVTLVHWAGKTFWEDELFFNPLAEARELVFDEEPLSATRRYLQVHEALMAHERWVSAERTWGGSLADNQALRSEVLTASKVRAALLMAEAAVL